MTRGQSARRLIDMVMSFVGHLRGGSRFSAATACSFTMFGRGLGLDPGHVVVIVSPLRPRMLKAGYSDSFTLALIINASDIAFLIPPSIRDDHLRRCLGHLDRRALHRRHRARSANPRSFLNIFMGLRRAHEAADRAQGPLGRAGRGAVRRRRSGRWAFRPCIIAASTSGHSSSPTEAGRLRALQRR